MKHWPLSTIAESPLMPSALAWEVRELCNRPPSQAAYYACADVARQTQPSKNDVLAIIDTLDAMPARIFTDYPDFDAWVKLERGTIVEADNGMFFILIGTLH